jgi:hypothetical protein
VGNPEVPKGLDQLWGVVRPHVPKPALCSHEVHKARIGIVGRLGRESISIDPTGSAVVNDQDVFHSTNARRFLIVKNDVISCDGIAKGDRERPPRPTLVTAVHPRHLGACAIHAPRVLGMVGEHMLETDGLKTQVAVWRHNCIVVVLFVPPRLFGHCLA